MKWPLALKRKTSTVFRQHVMNLDETVILEVVKIWLHNPTGWCLSHDHETRAPPWGSSLPALCEAACGRNKSESGRSATQDGPFNS